MHIEQRLRETADRITVALDALLPRCSGPEQRLLSAMRYAALAGGRRVRPFLCLEAGHLFDADETTLLRLATAVECAHTYSLIHDDLPMMDDDDHRRGQPSVHRQFDEPTALLAGDALLAFAFEILADTNTHPDPQMRCLLITLLAKACGPMGLAAGQMLDMMGPAIGEDSAAVARMNRLKTGSLICFALEAGALAGAASEESRQSLSRFGHDLGLAFQLADDLMDREGAEDEIGRPERGRPQRPKVNYVTLFGEAGARARMLVFAAQAQRHLAIFGPKARLLREAVDFVLARS